MTDGRYVEWWDVPFLPTRLRKDPAATYVEDGGGGVLSLANSKFHALVTAHARALQPPMHTPA